jgi:hypothetical protein
MMAAPDEFIVLSQFSWPPRAMSFTQRGGAFRPLPQVIHRNPGGG